MAGKKRSDNNLAISTNSRKIVDIRDRFMTLLDVIDAGLTCLERQDKMRCELEKLDPSSLKTFAIDGFGIANATAQQLDAILLNLEKEGVVQLKDNYDISSRLLHEMQKLIEDCTKRLDKIDVGE